MPVDQQIRDFDEARFLCEDFDRNSPIAQNALFAVDECDCALTRARIRVARIEGDIPGFGAEIRDVDGAFTFGAFDNGEFDGLVSEPEFCEFGHGGLLPRFRS